MTRVFAGNNFDGWRKHMTRCLLIAVSLLLLAQAARAQASEPSWNRLRIFHVGDKIQVVDQNLKSQNGTFIAFSEDAITYQMDQDAVTMQRDDVYRVSSLKSMSRTKHALIGLGIGAAWGLAFGIGGCAEFTDSSSCSGSDKAAAGATLGVAFGGVGAGFGALKPTDRPIIYRAERRQTRTAR
jgi:hypothetical protein